MKAIRIDGTAAVHDGTGLSGGHRVPVVTPDTI